MMPKSRATMRPSASISMLPGCMSAWKKPSRNTWLKKTPGGLRQDRVGVEAGGDQGRRARRTAQAAHPLEGHAPARAVRRQSTRGTAKALVVGAVLGELGGGRRLEAQVHLAPGRERQRPTPCRPAGAGAAPAAGARPIRRARAKKSRSRSIAASIPGRRTLTATSSPSRVTAKCTCAIEAAATGRSSKLANSSASGRSSSASTSWRLASRPGTTADRSCSSRQVARDRLRRAGRRGSRASGRA